MSLTEQVIAKAKEMGADLVGIAPVERFAGAPPRMSPKGLLPGARSVIVAAIHHPDAAVELGGEPTSQSPGPYNAQGIMNWMLDDLSFKLARFLEEKGIVAVPIAGSNVWRYKGYKDLKVSFAPDLAHRYAAVAAGLGEIGWSGLALTREFGPRQRFVSVVTEAELDPTPMYGGPALCDKCMACVRNCPTDAFRKEVAKINEIEIGGKTFTFPDTNKWRCSWSENFCLDLDLPIPEKVDEAVILATLEKHGWRGGEEGCCLRFCMVPERRYQDPSYCRAPRRKKDRRKASRAALTAEVAAVFRKHGLDGMAIRAAKGFDPSGQVRPSLHLPDAESVISLGVRIPEGCAENDDVKTAVYRRLAYAAFEIAHLLDIAGYQAVYGTRLRDSLAARKAGLHRPGWLYLTVLSGAPLAAGTHLRKKAAGRLTPDGLRKLCRAAGADLVGFFTPKRFDAFRKAAEKKLGLPRTREAVVDTGFIYDPYIPEVRTETVRLKGPEDWLSGARGVIVLGIHFPDGALDTAKVTPAETTGPITYVQCETLYLLGDAMLPVIRRLSDAGFRTAAAFDLTGLAGKVQNPRFQLTDMRSNLYPAMLAGLAYPGVHGHPLTAEYGVRQRFVAIVTDLPLPDDPLYAGENACASCDRRCAEACPTKAICNKSFPLTLEGRTFRVNRLDDFACEWAKRYCLSGEEGPRSVGLDVDVPVPAARDAEAIAKAVTSVKWGVQKRLLNIAEECLRVCPAGRRRARPRAAAAQGTRKGAKR